MLRLLYQPIDAIDLPLAVASYAVRGQQAGALNILISVEVGSGTAVRGPVRWGATILAGDKLVASTRATIDSQQEERSTDTAIVTVPPGQYALHVAAMDGTGRGSAFQVPLEAGLHVIGSLAGSDLMVGSAKAAKLHPLARIKASEGLAAAAELYARTPENLETANVRIELIPEADTRPIASGPMATTDDASGTTLALHGVLDTSELPSGRYVAHAVIWVDGAPAGRISRAVEIVR